MKKILIILIIGICFFTVPSKALASYDIKNTVSNILILKATPKSTTDTSIHYSSKFCDIGITSLIEKYWGYIMFLVPLLLIVMITIDFLKAVSTGDADTMKKSSSNAIKRVIAAIILLALPWVLNVIFGWFGLKFCF